MYPESDSNDALTLRDYVRVLRLRKWLVLAVALLLPLAAVLYSLQQERVYQAEADVLISRENVGASLAGAGETLERGDPDRLIGTQAAIASSPIVGERVLEAMGLTDRTPQEFLAAAKVTQKPNTDILEFRVTDPDAALAARLATEYARQFTIYRQELDTAALQRAREGLEAQIAALEKSRRPNPALYADLVSKNQQLRTLEALETGNASLVHPARDASAAGPKPVRNALLGVGLGLILGVLFAFLAEAVAARARSTTEIGERLGLPLLARVPRPPRRLRGEDQLAMIADPHGRQAEAFRVLRTNLDLGAAGRDFRSIAITSAIKDEGKSTTAANLAVAFARAGRRVIVVDLDLARPSIADLFMINGRPGVTDVALGDVELEDALVPVALAEDGPLPTAERETNGHGDVHGVLHVLAAGSPPTDGGEFIASHVLAELLETLSARADVVLVDAPPLLTGSDAMALSASVHALVVVLRFDHVRRPVLSEVRRTLERCPAEKLGFIVTGTDAEGAYDYGARRDRRYERLLEKSLPGGRRR